MLPWWFIYKQPVKTKAAHGIYKLVEVNWFDNITVYAKIISFFNVRFFP